MTQTEKEIREQLAEANYYGVTEGLFYAKDRVEHLVAIIDKLRVENEGYQDFFLSGVVQSAIEWVNFYKKSNKLQFLCKYFNKISVKIKAERNL